MDRSRFLGKVIGIYCILLSIAMFTQMQQFMDYVNRLLNDNPLMFVSGFFTLILGILLIVTHNIWQWSWRTLITLVAWIVFLKGATIIFFPQFIDRLSMHFVQSTSFAYCAAGLDLILGLVLCYFGFKH